MEITKVNKDFFTRVAPIRSLYTVVGFQFKFTKNPILSKEELSKGELSRMCQHNISRLRSQQPMVRPLYLQELNLRFYTSMSPSQEYFRFVHLGVVTKQNCSFKENCCKNGCTPQNSWVWKDLWFWFLGQDSPARFKPSCLIFLVYFVNVSKNLQENCEYHHQFLCSLEWLT